MDEEEIEGNAIFFGGLEYEQDLDQGLEQGLEYELEEDQGVYEGEKYDKGRYEEQIIETPDFAPDEVELKPGFADFSRIGETRETFKSMRYATEFEKFMILLSQKFAEFSIGHELETFVNDNIGKIPFLKYRNPSALIFGAQMYLSKGKGEEELKRIFERILKDAKGELKRQDLLRYWRLWKSVLKLEVKKRKK